MIPLFGGEISRGYDGWNFSSGSVMNAFSDAGALAKGIKDQETIDKLMDKLIRMGENTAIYGAGVPVTGIKRILNAATEADIAELLGRGWTD